MLRISKHNLKFTNKEKLNQIEGLYNLYSKQLIYYVDLIKKGKLPHKTFLTSKELPDGYINHSRYKQLIYKRASEIVRSEINKLKTRIYKRYQKLYYKCSKSNKHERFTSKLYKDLNIDIMKRVKVDIKRISVMLDERFFDIEQGRSFDEFVNIKLPIFHENKKRLKQVNIPIKQHKQSLKFKDWNRKKCIQLEKIKGKFYLVYFYEKEAIKNKDKTNKIGIDIGYKKLISDSNGVHYGVNLKAIYESLARKQKGSKNYLQTLEYKRNETNRIVNKFYELNHPDLVILEDLKDVKKSSKLHRKFNNKLQYWSYLQVIEKLEKLSEIKGFEIKKVEPAYTSQTCSKCKVVNKSNRNGEIYQCTCGLLIDADTNAAINILHRGVYSPSITKNNFQ